MSDTPDAPSPSSSDGSPSPSPSNGDSTASTSPRNAREWLTERSQKNLKSSETPRAKISEDEGLAADAPADDDAGESKSPPVGKEKNTDKSAKPQDARVQKRMDQLTARYHDAEKRNASQSVELERYKKATEMLQSELERISKSARLDPNVEAQRRAATDKEIAEFNASITGRDTKQFEEATQEWEVQTRADDILSEVNELIESKYGMTSLEEVLIKMRDSGDTAEKCARDLHTQRLRMAQKYSAPKHPGTTANSGATSTSAVSEPYQGRESIAKFLKEKMASRTGRTSED